MSSSEILSSEECNQIIKVYLQTDDYKELSVDISPLGGAPAGFMSDHYKIRAQVLHPSGSVQELKFFAKTIPRNVPTHTDYVVDCGSYFKETNLYSKIVPYLRKFQVKEESVNKNLIESFKNFRWVPQCLFTRSDIIVLQDLSVYNFKTFSNREVMDLKHCEVVLKELANFHAATIILEEREASISGKPCRIDKIYPVVFDETIGRTLEQDDSKGWLKASVRSLLPVVELLPKYKENPEVRSVIRGKLPDACNRVQDLVAASTKYRNVVCHGDLWANNILIQYDNNGEPLEARFVDFQLVRYTPPAHDVMCFLHLTIERSLRDANIETLLSIYYDAFSYELRRHDLDPDHLLSSVEFRASCDHLKELGIIMAVLYFQMILMKGEYTAPIFASAEEFNRFMLTNRSTEVCESFLTDEVYRWRLNEAMEQFIEHCILNEK